MKPASMSVFSLTLVLALAGCTAAPNMTATSTALKPEQQIIQNFLVDLRSGKAKQAVACLGSKGCSCSPPGGWAAYLIYESGLEPNAAFLIGQPYSFEVQSIGPEVVDPKYKDVVHRTASVKLKFENDRPYLLPMKTAFGSSMTSAEFQRYTQSPQKEGMKGLTLRLRKSMNKGSIATPIDLKDIPTKQTDEKSPDPSELSQIFGDELSDMLSPSDPAPIISTSGSSEDVASVAARLPRLKQLSLKMDLVRNQIREDWKIWRYSVEQPLVETSDQRQVVLSTTQKKLL